MNLIQLLQNKTNLPINIIENIIKLLDDGCTIPFIARYRKEVTGNLDEVQISAIKKLQNQFNEIVSRKEFILKTLNQINFFILKIIVYYQKNN